MFYPIPFVYILLSFSTCVAILLHMPKEDDLKQLSVK